CRRQVIERLGQRGVLLADLLANVRIAFQLAVEFGQEIALLTVPIDHLLEVVPLICHRGGRVPEFLVQCVARSLATASCWLVFLRSSLAISTAASEREVTLQPTQAKIARAMARPSPVKSTIRRISVRRRCRCRLAWTSSAIACEVSAYRVA